ncbi:hypothetical protein MIR68_000101 [Amoeboaphelidium protococcarum]|nr:hypothetical protein MIR68_000101 [Amoeboaphelidium protococcarum]
MEKGVPHQWNFAVGDRKAVSISESEPICAVIQTCPAQYSLEYKTGTKTCSSSSTSFKTSYQTSCNESKDKYECKITNLKSKLTTHPVELPCQKKDFFSKAPKARFEPNELAAQTLVSVDKDHASNAVFYYDSVDQDGTCNSILAKDFCDPVSEFVYLLMEMNLFSINREPLEYSREAKDINHIVQAVEKRMDLPRSSVFLAQFGNFLSKKNKGEVIVQVPAFLVDGRLEELKKAVQDADVQFDLVDNDRGGFAYDVQTIPSTGLKGYAHVNDVRQLNDYNPGSSVDDASGGVNAGLIAGMVIMALVIVGAIIGGGFYYRRRKQREQGLIYSRLPQ